MSSRVSRSAGDSASHARPTPPPSGVHWHHARHTGSPSRHSAGRRRHDPRPEHSTTGTSVSGSTATELPGHRAGAPGQGCVLQACHWVASPAQALPPWLGAGALHSRWRCCQPGNSPTIPAAHEELQALQSLHGPQPPSSAGAPARQAMILHDRTSSVSPAQAAPPGPGGGLVQLRVRVCVPSPQPTEHADHADHADSPPAIVPEPPEAVLVAQLTPVHPSSHTHAPSTQRPCPEACPHSALAHAGTPPTSWKLAVSSFDATSVADSAVSTS